MPSKLPAAVATVEQVDLAMRSKMTGAVVYSISGILLTLLNKVAIKLFPYACLLLIIQNIMTVLLLLAGSAFFRNTLGRLPTITWAMVRQWAPLSCLFVAMLVSSLLALKDVSAVTLVVLRNLTTLVVAVGERQVLRTRLAPQTVAALVGMLFGAIIYGASDLSFHARGYAWVGVNILTSSTYQVYIKTLAKDADLTPLGMSYINNVVSIPILAVCSISLEEPGALLGELWARGATGGGVQFDGWTPFVVVVTGILGYALSTSAFLLNKLISATSIMVINNANKFGVILLSELCMERSLGPLSTVGTILVLVYAYFYSQCPKQPPVQQQQQPQDQKPRDLQGQPSPQSVAATIVLPPSLQQSPDPHRYSPTSPLRMQGNKGQCMAPSKVERLDRKEVSDTAGARAVTLSVMVSGLLAAYAVACASLVGVAPDGNALLSPWSFTRPVQGITGTSSSLSLLVAVPHLVEDHRLGRGSGVDPAHPYAAFLPQVMEGQVAQEYPPGIMIPRMEPTYFEADAEFAHCAAIKSQSPNFQACDGECKAANSTEVVYSYPASTTKNESVADAIDRALRYAWGPRPPKVDLYIRTGCMGIEELHFLLPSITLFWPRFLGKVIIVLDSADRAFASHFAPRNPEHAYEIRFEHTPCMPGRVFNQVSYLMADKHSDADYLVTIDSDCVFHSPVTPDLLFGTGGKLLLPYSAAFQAGLWTALVNWFTGPGTYRFHTMVSQPVSFHRSTLKAFRAWYDREKGQCYLDRVNELLKSGVPVDAFCWMCQLGAFMAMTNETLVHYDMVDLDSVSSAPYQRLSIHTTYEGNRLSFADASDHIVREGLCRAIGPTVLAGCLNQTTDYIDSVTFNSAGWNFASTPEEKTRTVADYLGRLKAAFRHIGYD